MTSQFNLSFLYICSVHFCTSFILLNPFWVPHAHLSSRYVGCSPCHLPPVAIFTYIYVGSFYWLPVVGGAVLHGVCPRVLPFAALPRWFFIAVHWLALPHCGYFAVPRRAWFTFTLLLVTLPFTLRLLVDVHCLFCRFTFYLPRCLYLPPPYIFPTPPALCCWFHFTLPLVVTFILLYFYLLPFTLRYVCIYIGYVHVRYYQLHYNTYRNYYLQFLFVLFLLYSFLPTCSYLPLFYQTYLITTTIAFYLYILQLYVTFTFYQHYRTFYICLCLCQCCQLLLSCQSMFLPGAVPFTCCSYLFIYL